MSMSAEQIRAGDLRRNDVIADLYVPDVRLKVVDVESFRRDVRVTAVQQQDFQPARPCRQDLSPDPPNN